MLLLAGWLAASLAILLPTGARAVRAADETAADKPPAKRATALLPEREWSDATGMFRIRGTLLAIDGDSVLLRQPDGSEMTIEIGQLSRADQHVALRTKRRLARAETPLKLTAFDATARAVNREAFPPLAAEGLAADPPPGSFALMPGRVEIPRADQFDRVGRLIPVGGPAGVVLVAVENVTPGRPLPTRLVWASLKSGKVLRQHLLGAAEIVLDYHADLERLLTLSREKSTAEGAARQTLTLWDVAPGLEAAKPWLSWTAPCGDGESLARTPWGRVVDDRMVLHQSSLHEYTGWDIDASRAAYRIKVAPGRVPVPIVSGGRRWLAVPDIDGVQVCDTADGRIVASFPVGNVCGVGFAPDGRRLAVVQNGNVQIRDLGELQSELQAPIPLFPAHGAAAHRTAVAWAGPDHLLVQSARGLAAVLYSIAQGLPLWRYQWQPVQSGENLDDMALRIVAGHLLYAAPGAKPDVDAEESSGKQGGKLAVVVAVALPEPAVRKAEATLAASLPALITPGTAVSTKVPLGGDHDRIVAALATIFARTGWVYDAASPAVLEAGAVGEGIVRYKDAAGRERQLKQVTPTTLSVRLVVHGITLLGTQFSTDIPENLRLAAGQTEQEMAAAMPPPDVGTLERLLLPATVLDTHAADGLGVSECTADGLVTRPAPSINGAQ
ncbi:MAG: hypothetical protein DWH79_06345 [Planctomycetota bacterium]|nr:MAG: hypothetical protein DWH79_06345 [Planctomycetota bacterium]